MARCLVDLGRKSYELRAQKNKTAIEISNAKDSHLTVKDVAEQFHRWRSARDLSTINPREDYNS